MLKCYLDRFEGDYAVLLIEGAQVDFPRILLPDGAIEGDHLMLDLGIDTGSRNDTGSEISRIRGRLDTGNK